MSAHRSDGPDKTLDAELLALLVEAIEPAAPPADLRARVLEQVRTASALLTATSRVKDGPWKTIAPGIDVKTLRYDSGSDLVSFLLRVQPGGTMPAHSHRAIEECLVLEGDFTMGGVTLRAGDFQLGHPGEEHPEASTRSGVLVYLRGSADDYPFARP
jgi:anti-sigma factor ChrR (cupin superfamily)